MKTFQPASYSYNWSREVVSKVVEKYPRATKILYELLGITDRDLVNYLAHRDPLWPVLRDLIHRIDICLQIHPNPARDLEVLTFFRRRLQNFTGLGEKERLTARINSLILREQVERTELEGHKPDNSAPSILEDGLVQYTLFSL